MDVLFDAIAVHSPPLARPEHNNQVAAVLSSSSIREASLQSPSSSSSSSRKPAAGRAKVSANANANAYANANAHAKNATHAHRCHICSRSYERADHLHRHLRSHENARQHQCSRCPKRFNRADLLSRHEVGHDRAGGQRREVNERVSIACLACVASKCKCEDEKPCSRCRRKKIPCEVSPHQTQKRRQGLNPAGEKSTGGTAAFSPEKIRERSTDAEWAYSQGMDINAPTRGGSTQLYVENNDIGRTLSPGARIRAQQPALHSVSQFPQAANGRLYDTDPSVERMAPAINQVDLQHPAAYSDFPLNDDLGFLPRSFNFGQDLEFGFWDIDFGGFDTMLQNTPELSEVEANADQDASKRSAAFHNSLWSWTPTNQDRNLADQAHLNLDEASISTPLKPYAPIESLEQFSSCCIDSSIRDQLLYLLFALRSNEGPIRTFAPLRLLNIIIPVFFVQERLLVDHFIHTPTFNPPKVLPQLLLAIIAAGATLISTPAVWKMGLALQEAVQHTVLDLCERNNLQTRNVQALQAMMVGLNVGLWSGVKRKMELAEAMSQPIIVILRRAGALSTGKSSPALIPTMEDSEAVVQTKWEKFVERESFKRLVLHMFMFDTHSSIGFQKPPHMSFTELDLELPVSREIWLAQTAIEWRDIYIKKQVISAPTFMEALHDPQALYRVASQVDINLSIAVILHGYWGPTWRLADARKFYNDSKAAYRLCLLTEHDELSRDLASWSLGYSNLLNPSPAITLAAELLQMTLHVSPECLQRYLGKYGEDQSNKAAMGFETWIQTPHSRSAIWHAGQVLRAAKFFMSTQLRDFPAMAVYYATLTLWVYGVMTKRLNVDRLAVNQTVYFDGGKQIVLNESTSSSVTTFRATGVGVPGISIPGRETKTQFVPLTDTDRILGTARDTYRRNFALSDGPLPTLVENLGNLLHDLSSRPRSQESKAASEETR